MLSDKAKGKQRAVKGRSQADSGTLTLRCTAGFLFFFYSYPTPTSFVVSRPEDASRAVPETVPRPLPRYTTHVLG